MKEIMNTQKKIVKTKEDIIKTISRKEKKDISEVRDIYRALENTIFDLISNIEPNSSLAIRLFEGFVINSDYVPEKRKKNNLTGKEIVVDSHIKPKVSISRTYCEKLNS